MAKLPYAIVGGGLMGASLAYNLSRLGNDVLLIDDHRVGRASNWNPGGINPLHGPGFPDLMQNIYRQAFELHLMEHENIRALSGIDFNWKVVTRLFLAKDDIEMRDLEKSISYYNEMPNFSSEFLNQNDLKKFDSRLSSHIEGGLLTKGNVSIQSENFRLALLAASEKLGAKVLSGTLARVTARSDRIHSIQFGHDDLPIAGLCMAVGAWERLAIDGWSPGFEHQIHSLIGDLIFVRSTGKPLGADIGCGINAVYKHDENHYWIGGTTRKDGNLGECTDAIARDLILKINELIPGWDSFEVLSKASAARPVTQDGLPLLGPVPAYKNAWVINGGSSKGVLLSLWLGKMTAQIIKTGEVPSSLLRFLPR